MARERLDVVAAILGAEMSGGGGGGGGDVTGVKGSAESTYRKGNVNITAKNIGVEAGAEVNKIGSITLNGTEVTPDANKNVALTVITNTVDNLINYYLKSETYNKTEVDNIINTIKNGRFKAVPELPTTDIETNVIYLVPKSTAQTDNVKNEYINLDGTTSGWEKIGDTEIDLSNYVTTTALNTALANYTTTTDLTSLLADKVSKSDTAGLLKNDGSVDTTTYATKASVDAIKDGQSIDSFSDVETALAGKADTSDIPDITGKADKVESATANNFAGLDANGNLKDSGKKASDFATPKNVQDSINTSADLLKDTVGWTGKNLLPYPYKDSAKTHNGVTYAYNSDNTITANGEATSTSWRTLTEDFSFLEPGKKYRLSGCPTGGSSNSYLIQLTYNDGTEKYIQEYGNGIDFTYTGDFIRLQVIVKENYTANNLVFKPMIRRADITDNTYEPFHESVETMYEEEIHGVNLLRQLHGTETKNGVTFTQNTDGSVTVNGTASVNTGHEMISTADTGFNGNFRLPVGRYILSGCPKSGSWETYSLYFQMIDDNGTWLTQYKDEGNGVEFDITETNKDYRFLVSIRAQNGVAISNVTFYPMLRKADIDDSSYRPYNYQAIQNQLNAQGVLGAKNLLPQVEHANTALTINGVTITSREDGSVLLNGTSTDAVSYHFIRLSSDAGRKFIKQIAGKKVTISGTNILNTNPRVQFWSPATNVIADTTGKGTTFTIPSDLATTGDYNFAIWMPSGVTLSNIVVYPMLRLASDPDNTYQPYAMTNMELTKKVLEEKLLTSTDDLNNVIETGLYIIREDIPANSPENTNWCSLLVNKVSTNNVQQQLFKGQYLYQRKYSGVSPTWGSWYKFTGTEV